MKKILPRRLALESLLARKSFFLFGPRSVGKTTLIREQLDHAKVYDLLDATTLRRLIRQPSILLEENRETPRRIVAIDEIQKLPSLLDEVHRLIEQHEMTFLLTGSSARKLKRGASNLLAGRAWWAELYPLVYPEIPDFELLTYLNNGGLPHIYGSPDAVEELQSYVALYLQEEVQAEALTRNLAAFATFLEVIALGNGQELNYDSLASDCGVASTTIKNYIQILEDTLLGYSLPGFTYTKKRKAITRAKHYLFDIGVVNTLSNRGEIRNRSPLFGNAFEHFVIGEVRAYLSYSRSRETMTYWRSTSQFEVDLLIGKSMAIEIKGTDNVGKKHLRGLRALMEERLIRNYAVVSLDRDKRTTDDGIVIWPWRQFLTALWANELL